MGSGEKVVTLVIAVSLNAIMTASQYAQYT